MNKLLSVIVPVYNVANYLERCVESISSQDYQPIEIILVDDGSTDGSSNLCDRLSDVYPSIKVIHKKNGGLSDARNAGIDVCMGEYVSFIDSDDWIDPGMYSNMISKIISTDSDICICRRQRAKSKNEKVLEQYRMYPNKCILNTKEGLIGLLSFKGYDMSVCDKVFKRSVLGEIRFPYGKTCEDSFTTYKLFSSAKKIYYLDTPYYNYFYREGSITRNSNVNETVIEATNEQYEFIVKKFPELESIATISRIYAILSVANEYAFRNKKWCKEKENIKYVRKNIYKVVKCKDITLMKKLQIILYSYMNNIYSKIIMMNEGM